MHNPAQKFIDSLKGFHRLHNSSNANLAIKFNRKKERIPIFDKPNGFWYDINGDWIRWCLAEEIKWIRPYFYEVIIDESKIISINTVEQFEKFEKKYLDIPKEFKTIDLDYQIGLSGIAWDKVAKEYSGCEIHPYLWEKRLTSKWYYTWDCASGSVWDRNAFKIKPFAYYDRKRDEFIYSRSMAFCT